MSDTRWVYILVDKDRVIRGTPHDESFVKQMKLDLHWNVLVSTDKLFVRAGSRYLQIFVHPDLVEAQ